jgi:hypothetical protein
MATTNDISSNPPAAWFPDPWGAAEMRYWDGSQWTGHVHPPAVSQAPAATPAQPTSVGAPPAAASPVAAAPVAGPASSQGSGDAERRKQLVTIALAIAIAIVVVIAILRIAGV